MIKLTKNKLDVIEDAAKLVECVWTKIDFDNISNQRNINDEFASRIATAAFTDDVASFVQRLSSKMGVRSIMEDKKVIEIIERSNNDREFLKIIRNHSTLVVLKMKEMRGNLDDN